MAGTYTNLWYHIVFSTKERRRLITPNIEDELHKYIGGIVRNLEGKLIAANGDLDHRHLLVLLKPKFAVSDVVRDIKASSSGWLNERVTTPYKFGWQDGYGAFTVSHSQLDDVERYIERQKEHHRQISFQDEFLALLKKNEIEYDERYIWN